MKTSRNKNTNSQLKLSAYLSRRPYNYIEKLKRLLLYENTEKMTETIPLLNNGREDINWKNTKKGQHVTW